MLLHTLRNFCCKHVRLSASHWWCLWACPNSAKWTWYSLILGWRLMAHAYYNDRQRPTTVMSYWISSCFLLCMKSLASSFSSSKTVLLHTEHARQSAFWNGRQSLSFHETGGFQQPRSETGWLQNLGKMQQRLYQTKFYDIDEVKQRDVCSVAWSNAWSMTQ